MLKCHTEHIIVLDLDHLNREKKRNKLMLSPNGLYVKNSLSAKHETAP